VVAFEPGLLWSILPASSYVGKGLVRATNANAQRRNTIIITHPLMSCDTCDNVARLKGWRIMAE
jgi:hypothetical protein